MDRGILNTAVRVVALLGCLFVGAVALQGQSFVQHPDPLPPTVVYPDMANVMFVHFENLTDDSLRLRWRRMEMVQPEGWTTDLCDYGDCYIGVPASGWMNTAPPDVQPYLKLIVQPHQIPGQAYLHFRVYNAADQSDYTDVFITLLTPGVSAMQSPDLEALPVLYPNPAREGFTMLNPVGRDVEVRIVASDGTTMWEGLVPAGQAIRVDASRWPSGMYLAGKQKIILTHTR